MSKSFNFAIVFGFTLLPPCLAFAGGELSPTADIAGVTLNIPSEQAKNVILQNDPGATISEINVTFGTKQVKRNMLAGYAVDINTSTQDGSNDAMRITFDPNQGDHKVFAISRYIGYPKTDRPVVDAAVSNFIEKYGEPSFKNKGADGSVYLYWGARGKNDSLLNNCKHEAEHYNYPVDRGVDYKNYDSGYDVTGSAFNYLVNYIDQPSYFKDWKACGTFLEVHVLTSSVVGEETDVAGIKEFYIDFPAAYTAVKRYVSDFWAEADGAKKQDQDARSQKKIKM